jgi:hypothetical protein
MAPRDVRLNQRLAALHTRAGRFAEAAVCCRTLESVYHEAGYPDDASRYGELAGKYEERTSAVAEAPVASQAESAEAIEVSGAKEATPASSAPFFHAPSLASATAGEERAAAAEQEIDLSEEWEGSPADSTDEAKEAAPTGNAADRAAKIAETAEEIRFYLAQSMVEQAKDALAALETWAKDAAETAALRDEVNAALSQASAQSEEITVEPVDTLVESEAEAAAASPEPEPQELQEMVSELDLSLGSGFPVQPPAPVTDTRNQGMPVAACSPEPAVMQHASADYEAGNTLGEFVSDLETSLGDNFLAQAPQPTTPAESRAPEPEPVVAEAATPVHEAEPTPIATASSGMAAAAAPAREAAPEPVTAAPAQPYQPGKIKTEPAREAAAEASKLTLAAQNAARVDLTDMFGELKQELEADAGSSDEDPETHYNLGVAFREMGLLDEAIGELQKVCQAVEHGQPFSQIMQTYTWLAQCFLDKGVPEAAVRWYEAALQLRGLDEDTRMALRYELGSSQESAGNRSAALQQFMAVYASNIDYRDVGERIRALKS